MDGRTPDIPRDRSLRRSHRVKYDHHGAVSWVARGLGRAESTRIRCAEGCRSDALDAGSCFSNVPIICFNAFICIEPRDLNTVPEDLNVWPISSRKYPPLIQARCPFKMSTPISYLSADLILYLCDANAGPRLVMRQSTPSMLRKQSMFALVPGGLFLLFSKAAPT